MSAGRPMTDRELRLFEAFKLAIQGEREAQGEYGTMAALCDDPQMRALFEGFEREEAAHEEKLVRLYAEFKARCSCG